MNHLIRRAAFGLSLVAVGVTGHQQAAFAAEFDPAPIERAVKDAQARLSARIGVVVVDRQTGENWTHRAQERFPLNSTFKTFLCAALLHQGEAGETDPARRVEIRGADLVSYSPVTETKVGTDGMTLLELCEATVTKSDNTAANLVLDDIGGPDALNRYLRGIGDTVTRLDRREPEMNYGQPGDERDTTTPAAAAATLQKLVLGNALSADAKKQLQSWLEDNRVGNSTLRAGLPAGWKVADKTGAGGNGSRSNIAVIWPEGRAPVVVAVYITETQASFKARNQAIADIGRAIASALKP